MAADISISTTIVRSPDPLSATVDGEVILMIPNRGNYVGMNAIASAVWERLAVPTKISELIGALQQDYDGAPDRIAADVLALLSELAALDLVTVMETPAA